MTVKQITQTKRCVKILIAVVALYLLITSYVNYKNNRLEFNVNSIVRMSQRDENNYGNVFVLPLSDEILDIHRRLNLTNPGHLGVPVVLPENLPEDIRSEVRQSNDEFKFNEFVSRLIPLDRDLGDLRQGTCRTAEYSSNLPKASVVLAFYNEPFSMVMRTIYGVLKRSPDELLEEILLVDDCSDKGFIA